MVQNAFNVLFLCTGNSARSILAEAILNHASNHGGKFRGYSAGSHPKDNPHPFAIELLRRNGIPTEALRSKSWDEFAGPGAPELHFVFTVCDQAAGEQCPYWPGRPVSAHWGLPDPAAVTGGDDEKRRAFLDTFLTLQRRIDLFAKLPLDSLDASTLAQRVREIGRQ
jgi:arsenate reductase